MSDRTTKRKWDDAAEDGKPAAAALDPAAQAAAIAAKIAATIAPAGGAGVSPPVGAASSSSEPPRAKDLYDGAFTHDIEINDLRNRYLVTKGSTQQQISSETGASVTTKGTWIPDKSKATGDERPLYIHIAAPTKAQLDAATKKVQEVIDSELGPLVEDRSQWARNRERYGAPGGGPPGAPGVEGGGGAPGGGPGGHGGRRKWPEEKIPIGLESARNFNVRAKVVGPGGMFVKYIQAETGTRVQIKGLGSGFYENDTGMEANEPMHVSVSGPDESQVAAAKELAEDLLIVVREEYAKAQAGFGGYGGGGAAGGGGGGYGGGYQQQQQQQQAAAYGGGYGGSPAAAGATPAAAAGGDASQDPAAQYEAYRAYWAQYGYDVNDPAFQAWQAQQYGAAAGAGATPGSAPGAAAEAAPGATPASATSGTTPAA